MYSPTQYYMVDYFYIHAWKKKQSFEISRNSEAFTSEFLENLEDIFPRYW